jgi:hypothetical protein
MYFCFAFIATAVLSVYVDATISVENLPVKVDKNLSNGKHYIGEVLNHKLHGKGTLSFPDGSKYTGNFFEGKRHGHGQMLYADGSGRFVVTHLCPNSLLCW